MKRLLRITGGLLVLLALGAPVLALAVTFGRLRTDVETPALSTTFAGQTASTAPQPGASVTLAGQAASTTDYTLKTADNLTLSLSADGQVTDLQIDGQGLVSAPAPALLLRDLSAAGQVTAPNLATNPGFEEGLAGWTQLTNSGLDVSVVVSPTHSGDASLQFASTGESPAFAASAGSPAPVVPGRRYRISAWWRSATGYVAFPSGPSVLWQMTLWRTPSRANGLYVLWLDANSQPLGDAELAVPLHLNAANWRLIRRELTAPAGAAYARPIVAAKLQAEETLWVDDVALVPSPEPETALAGVVARCPGQDDCLQQTITLSSGLALTITYIAQEDHIAIHGSVVDSTQQNRALDINWAIPFEPVIGPGGMHQQGGPLRLWWDDVHNSRQITQTTLYGNAVSAIYDGWLPMSLYPYSGVQIASKGVALGLPLDHPQLALLAYDGASGRYGATYHLGISPQATKVGPQATFDLLLYRFDPARGFRDVIARHRLLQPEAYALTRPLYNYADAKQGLFFTEHGAQQVLAHDAANIYSAQYTLGELPLKLASSSDPRPTLDQALVAVTDTLDSPDPSDAARARAIINSAVVDPNGDWSLKHIGVYPWAPDWWEVSWAANLDPDLDEGLASWIMDWRVTPAFTKTTQAGAHLDGVQIDNFMSTPTLDLRPASLAAADWPLAYSPHTYQPAVHNGFSHHEYLSFLRDYLDTAWGNERGISINFWGLGNPNYLAEFIDAFGGEGNLRGNGEGENWNPEILDYRRSIAYGRPYHFANQTDELSAAEAYTFTQMALLYGVRPGRGPNASQWTPEVERMFTDTVALVTRYWAAGWEPLTYAQADSQDVWIERFGDRSPPLPLLSGEGEGGQGGGGEVVFTVHNRAEFTRTAAITIEAGPLGITYPTSVEITDLATEQPVPFSVEAGNIVVSLYLGPRETRVLQVSGGATPRLVYLPLVAARWRQPWPPSNSIVLADGPGGLELVSAPVTIPITVGRVAYLPVEVLGYRRPITVSAQTLIHTYVNERTPAEPGTAPPSVVGTLQMAQSELKLQTLRMRTHSLALSFAAGGTMVNATFTLKPVIQPHTPLFGVRIAGPAWFGIPQPFERVFGPDCAPCSTTPGDPPGSTRDIRCVKQQQLSSCSCHPIQEILDPEEESSARRAAPQMQRYASQFQRSIGGWGDAQHAPDQYHWDALDWLFYTLTPVERDYSPLATGVMDGNYGWMTCPEYTNPDGSVGFFDPDNTFLVEQYVANVVARTARYAPDLRFVELSNEPAAEFYLCPCTVPGGPPCDATSGPNQPACLLGPNSAEFVATYGDLLFTAADAAAEGMAAANPDALLVTGALEMPPLDIGLSLTTEYMITRSLLTHDNVAVGIHQYPYLYPNWLPEPPNCAYFQVPGDPYWLPDGCETAPPFEDYTTPAGKLVHARDAWRSFDTRVDLSLLLHDAEALGVLDRIYFFDTELHAGWQDYDPTTTPAREAMAGLRVAAINAHQRVLGSEFMAPSDPAAYNLMVKYLAGVTPVYRWDAPLMDADYSGLVYKLFSRGDEDIIAVWNNAETAQALALLTGSAIFKQVTLTRFADAGGPLAISTTDLSAPPAAIRVEPLREFYFLSVISDRPGFGWLIL